MNIKKFEVGPLFVNSYIVYEPSKKEGCLIDPGDEPDLLLDFIKENNIKLQYIICTHGHFDHIGAVKELREETEAKVVIHKGDLEIYRNSPEIAMKFFGIEIEPQPEPDIIIEGDIDLKIASTKFKLIHTPGHSPGSMSIYFDGHLFTGDTLFAGSVGRTDLIGGDMKMLLNSLRIISKFPLDTIIYPGHGPKTKLEVELRTNPYYYEIR